MSQQRRETNQMTASIDWPPSASHRAGSLHGVIEGSQYQYFMYTNYGNHNQAGINVRKTEAAWSKVHSHVVRFLSKKVKVKACS